MLSVGCVWGNVKLTPRVFLLMILRSFVPLPPAAIRSPEPQNRPTYRNSPCVADGNGTVSSSWLLPKSHIYVRKKKERQNMPINMKAKAIAPLRRNLLCMTKERCLYLINPLLPLNEDYEQSLSPHTAFPALCEDKKKARWKMAVQNLGTRRSSTIFRRAWFYFGIVFEGLKRRTRDWSWSTLDAFDSPKTIRTPTVCASAND